MPALKLERFVAPHGRKVRLDRYDSDRARDLPGCAEAERKIEADGAELARQQDMLLARESHAVLLVFQGMDGAGKDGTIKHVMSSVDPQGCSVASFKKPAGRELKCDYLRRFVLRLPERGQIGIFNRSYYEEVVGTRVHPENLDEQNLPARGRPAECALWRRRFDEINHLEKYLVDNGILVVKFFLHITREQQRRRLLERISEPEKKWKYSPRDLRERGHWDSYLEAYRDVFRHTSTPWAPWYVVPAGERWLSAMVVGHVVLARLRKLDLAYPEPDPDEKREMNAAAKALGREG